MVHIVLLTDYSRTQCGNAEDSHLIEAFRTSEMTPYVMSPYVMSPDASAKHWGPEVICTRIVKD